MVHNLYVLFKVSIQLETFFVLIKNIGRNYNEN